LHCGTESILGVRLEIAESHHEYNYRVDATPHVSLFYLLASLRIAWKLFQIVILEAIDPNE